jgi:hypothetical protein
LQHVHNTKLANAQAFSFDIDERTKKLELIADWKDELRQRLADTVNDVWGPPPDLDELKAEVELFKMCSKGART